VIDECQDDAGSERPSDGAASETQERRANRRFAEVLAEAFYRVVDAAYERRSVAVTSNIHPSGMDTIMPKTLATATVDRLLHHAHLVLTKGDSHRLAEALAGKGVTPLT
jgi:DNA replication protein DnaC